MNRFHRSVLLAISATLAAAGACAADGTAPPGSTIAYVITNASWALQATPEMSECPHGLNDGVREQFKLLFPDVAGEKAHARRHPAAAPGRELSPDRRAGHAALPRGRRPGRAGTGPGRRGRARGLHEPGGCSRHRQPAGPRARVHRELSRAGWAHPLLRRRDGAARELQSHHRAVDRRRQPGRRPGSRRDDLPRTRQGTRRRGRLEGLAGRHAAHRYALGQPLYPADARAYRKRACSGPSRSTCCSRGMRSTCRPTITCGEHGSALR